MRNRITVTLAAAGLAGVALIATLAGSAPAVAIPTLAQNCQVNVQTNTAANGWQPVAGTIVWVNNPAWRRTVVHFNADAGVDTIAEIRLAYRVDAGPLQIVGASNFANHTEFWETRHNMSVLGISAGWHKVQPYWRISGAPGKNGVIHGRCMTVEGSTS